MTRLSARSVSVTVAYRGLLAFVCIAGFFTGLINYLAIVGLSPVRPAWWIVALALLSLPLAVSQSSRRLILATPLTVWCGLYAVMTIVWFVMSSQSDVAVEELVIRALSIAFLGVLLVLLADPRIHGLARWTVLFSVLIGILLNVYDIVRPLTFSPIVGRAAGLYLNPNISGSALVIGMVVSVGVLAPRVRPWYVLAVGAGVLLTLSRGALAAWVMAVGLLLWPRHIRVSTVSRGAGVFGVVVFALLALSERRLETAESMEDGATRVAEVLRLSEDYSVGFRKETAATAWEVFSDRPFLGRGVGSTLEWDVSESTHNILLRHLAEYGVVGAVLFPLFLIAIVARSRGDARRWAVTLVCVLGILGMVSHNVLDERHLLIAAALVSLMSAKSAAETSEAPRG